MKFTITIVLALMAFTSADINFAQKTATRLLAAYCGVRTGATYDQMQALNFGRFDSEIIDDKTKCFANCFMETVGFLKDGQVQCDKITKTLTPIVGEEAVAKVQSQCDKKKGTNKCETAFLLYTCYYNAYGPIPGKTEEKPKTWFIVVLEKFSKGIRSLKKN